MNQSWLLFRAVFRKRLTLLVRYPVNTWSQLVIAYVLFAIIFFGGKSVAAPTIEDSLDGLVVGFFLFTMASTAFSGLAWTIMHEAQWGTLEQLIVSPFSVVQLMATKLLANVLVSFLFGAIMLALMMVTTRKWLTVDLLTVGPIVVLGLLSIAGVGLLFGGLALLYKRIENGILFIETGIIGLIAIPVDSFPGLEFLPLVQSGDLLQRAMAGGVRLWEFPTMDLAILVGVAVVYLGVGYVVFHLTLERTRHLGVLGHY